MAKASLRRCYYCGGELQPGSLGNMLREADGHGNYGYCPDSPSRTHRDRSYGRPPDEAELRKIRRAIADGTVARVILEEAGAPDGALATAKRQWRDGTCDRCGTQTLVIGPDVQPLCVYCDELRTLPPLPVPKTPEQTRQAVRAALREPARPARSPIQRRRSDRRAVGVFVTMGLIMLAIPTEIAQTLAACLFGLAVIYGISNW